MSSVLLIPLVGPMQSWGTRSRFQIRDTERAPSKSGVIGILCAALGRDRAEPLDDLVSLKMGVRVDREGDVHKDYQTAQDVATADDSKANMISDRYFLSDAVFLVGLEGNDFHLLEGAHKALSNPTWALSLGRKSYVPSAPLYLVDGLKEGTDLRSALLGYPLLTGKNVDHGRDVESTIRLILESQTPTRESRMDTPVSFSIDSREYHKRFITTEFLPLNNFKEEDGTCICLK